MLKTFKPQFDVIIISKSQESESALALENYSNP